MARDAPSVDAYGEGGFRLSGIRHEGSVLILRDEAQPWPVREALAKAGIGLEFMDTPTASRMYNVLTAEGRRLACALIAI